MLYDITIHITYITFKRTAYGQGTVINGDTIYMVTGWAYDFKTPIQRIDLNGDLIVTTDVSGPGFGNQTDVNPVFLKVDPDFCPLKV